MVFFDGLKRYAHFSGPLRERFGCFSLVNVLIQCCLSCWEVFFFSDMENWIGF